MTIVRADNLLYFAVCQFVWKFREKTAEGRDLHFRVKKRNGCSKSFVRKFALPEFSTELLADGDLLLRRNLLVFCLYILVFKWRMGIVRNAVVLFFISFFFIFCEKRKKQKKRTYKQRRRYFVACLMIAKQEEERFTLTQMYTRLFLFFL